MARRWKAVVKKDYDFPTCQFVAVDVVYRVLDCFAALHSVGFTVLFS